VRVRQNKFRALLSDLWRSGSRWQPSRHMKNNKAKDGKDGNTQKRENRAYNLAAERFRPATDPLQARPEGCGTGSEQQEIRSMNISYNWESSEETEIADEGHDAECESQPNGQFQRNFSSRVAKDQRTGSGRTFPFRILLIPSHCMSANTITTSATIPTTHFPLVLKDTIKRSG
jgi:hypothetical protein